MPGVSVTGTDPLQPHQPLTMGIKRTEIVLQPGRQGTCEYTPGETVNGTMVLQIGGSKTHKLSALVVKVRGKAVTQWKTGSGADETRYSERQWPLRLDLPLLAASASHPVALPSGQHQFPFTFSLPSQLAYSQKHLYGKVSYECKARAISHSFWSFNGKAQAKFQVLPHRDLSREPHLGRPLTMQRQARSLLFGRDPGPFQLHLSRQGFVAGEVIGVWLDGPDRAFEVLAAANAEVQLKTRVVFRAEGKTKQTKRVPARIHPGTSLAAWHHIQLTVPAGEVSMDDNSGCTIISVTHYVKVRDAHLPVTLGTVPLPPS